jgi:hypothetical protein
MTIIRLVFLLPVLCLALFAQSKPAPTPPPGLIVSEASYPFPLAERDKIRDLQHEYDAIEIENQKMMVKIEQNKARQSALVSSIQLAAWEFSQAKKIDIGENGYEFDPAKISFVKKKALKP